MAARRQGGKARGRGEGTVVRDHGERFGCPPVGPDGERPEHPCRARWVAMLSGERVPGQARSRRRFYGRTYKEAWEKMDEYRRENRGAVLTSKAPSLEEWLNHFINVICVNKGLKIRTVEGYRGYADRYLIPYLGAYKIDRLQTDHIRAMYSAMRKSGLSDTTCNQAHRILSRALNVALSERRIPYNVAAVMADKPQATGEGREGLSLEEAHKVLQVAGDDPRPFVALYLGLRQGECLGLRWSDIDLNKGVLNVNAKLTVKRGGGWVLETPKTRKSMAALPIPTVVLSRLTVLHARHIAEGGDENGFVFGLENGVKPMGPKSDYNRWKNYLKAAGVGHYALHAARNTTADLLREAGVDPEDVRDIMRHTSQTMTRHYQSENMDLKRAAIAKLEAYIDGTPEPVAEPIAAGPVSLSEILTAAAALSPAERAALGAVLSAAPALQSA